MHGQLRYTFAALDSEMTATSSVRLKDAAVLGQEFFELASFHKDRLLYRTVEVNRNVELTGCGPEDLPSPTGVTSDFACEFCSWAMW